MINAFETPSQQQERWILQSKNRTLLQSKIQRCYLSRPILVPKNYHHFYDRHMTTNNNISAVDSTFLRNIKHDIPCIGIGHSILQQPIYDKNSHHHAEDTLVGDEETFWALLQFCEKFEIQKNGSTQPKPQLFQVHPLQKQQQDVLSYLNHESENIKQRNITKRLPNKKTIFKARNAATYIDSSKQLTSMPMHVNITTASYDSKKCAVGKMTEETKISNDKSSSPQLPIKPLSAYNFFFSDVRERILSGRGGIHYDNDVKYDDKKKQKLIIQHLSKDRSKRRIHRKTHGKVDFTTLTKTVGQNWRSLSKAQKQFYYDVAKMDAERYDNEIAIISKKQKGSKLML